MAEVIPADEKSNYETFRDCLSEPIMKALALPDEKPKPKKKRSAKKSSKEKNNVNGTSRETESRVISRSEAKQTDAEDLGEFIEYLSSIIFPSLPPDLRSLSYTNLKSSPSLQETYSLPLSASVYDPLLESVSPTALDSLSSTSLLPTPHDPTDLRNLLLPILHAYIAATTAPPPIWTTTRTTECELCGRDWVPLTYHHLIPKSTHERVLKRGWHEAEVLGSVAWLCRACHSFVHGLRGNEALARGFYTMQLIREGGVDGDEDVRGRVEGWVKWVGGVRWKSR
ncbi:hypothetical protein DE146DRAFT_790497 [Phaeosphaeria sp. MPI-PUGE-AT-0046c]|nr:hypothetical protein DE146DRAFT_790497 [Phaeosphaeria sp. MPI-PUGE-AT-0046c]